MKLEPALWIGAIAIFGGLVLREGRVLAQLEAQLGVEPAELYRQLSRSQAPLQIIDARDTESYLDTHIPGAIPFPACDGESQWVIASVPSVIVTPAGDRALFEKCAAGLTSARNLVGGMEAWSNAGQPEDEGEYSPPKKRAGGGCL
jgi:rhodanese-related sulfurtransferase